MSRRPGPPEDVYFPVVPMLDMAFQLLAFFILTFQAPSGETRIDLDLPSAPVALPQRGSRTVVPGRSRVSAPDFRPEDLGLETDLTVRAEADAEGHLRSLRLGQTPLPGPEALADRLQRYAELLGDRPLTVSLVADDALLYDDAAKLLGACSAAGITAVRLVPGGADPPIEVGESALMVPHVRQAHSGWTVP